jgi:glycosyltransferase involved in cell wall biosynthesis
MGSVRFNLDAHVCDSASLSVIIVPAYNEESNLTRTVLTAEARLRNQVAGRLEWVLVDDGSTDRTWSEITNLAHSIPNVISLRHIINRGLGAAIWTGMAQASSEWCTWMPADGQFAPQSYVDMVRLANESDLVLTDA